MSLPAIIRATRRAALATQAMARHAHAARSARHDVKLSLRMMDNPNPDIARDARARYFPAKVALAHAESGLRNAERRFARAQGVLNAHPL